MEFQRVVKTPTVHGIAVSALKAKRGFVWGLFCFFGRGGFFYITGMDKTEEIKKRSLSTNVFLYLCDVKFLRRVCVCVCGL